MRQTLPKSGHISGEHVIATLRSRFESLTFQRKTIRADAELRHDEIELRKRDFNRIIADIGENSGYVIDATVSGKLTSLAVREGQTVLAGDKLAILIPQDAIVQAELNIPSAAIGLLQEGQEVRLAIDAFPYRTFGTIGGKIERLSKATTFDAQTAVNASFYATVLLDSSQVRAFGNEYPLLPGMTLSARIVTQELSLFEILFESVFAVINR